MIHVALKLSDDILKRPTYKRFVVDKDEMISCVPNSLLMFLRLMFGGQSLLEADPDDVADDTEQNDSQARILCIAQDLVYNYL